MKLPKPFAIIAMLIPWCVAIGVVFYIFSIRFPLDGRVVFSHPLDGSGIWFTPFEPGERVTSPGRQPDGWRGQRILDEPVYASARWPGAYDELNINVEMRTLRQPIVELGLERDAATRAFEMKPLWSELLSSDDWREVAIDDARGFVRADLPDSTLLETDPRHLMVWHASTSDRGRADSGEAEEKTYEVSLRGTHHFLALPINDEIRFHFQIQDVNRNREGKNTFAIRVSCEDEIVWTSAGSASGLNDSRPSEVFEERVRLTELPPCAYKLSVLADNDFFIRQIRTNARHWVIGPQIFFGDRVGFRATTTEAIAWTNSIHAVADTFHKEGLQHIRFGSNEYHVRETHNRYILERAPDERGGSVRFSAPEGNMRLIGDGYFALEESALFYPEPRRLTAESEPAEEGIRAILTPYTKPVKSDNGFWKTGVAFELPARGDRLQFSLAAPGIDRSNGAVDIRSVELEYTRPPLSLNEWFLRMKREISIALKRL